MLLNIKKITRHIKETGNKELPPYFPPPVYFSLDGAVSFAILLSNEDTHEWFYSSFIQLAFYNQCMDRPTVHPLTIYPMRLINPKLKEIAIFQKRTLLFEDTMSFSRNNLMDNIIQWINNDYYVLSRINVAMLPKARHFNPSRNYIHGVCCIGYNDTLKTLKIVDFDHKGELSMLDVSYENFIDAFFSSDDKRVILSQMQKDIDYKINLEFIKEQIYEYVNSIDSNRRHSFIVPSTIPDYSWGLSVYEKLISFIDFRFYSTKYNHIDYRPFYALYEHKLLMMGRLQYLALHSLIDVSTLDFNEYQKIVAKAERIRMLVLKYNSSKEPSIIQRTKLYIIELHDLEKIFLQQMLRWF